MFKNIHLIVTIAFISFLLFFSNQTTGYKPSIATFQIGVSIIIIASVLYIITWLLTGAKISISESKQHRANTIIKPFFIVLLVLGIIFFFGMVETLYQVDFVGKLTSKSAKIIDIALITLSISYICFSFANIINLFHKTIRQG